MPLPHHYIMNYLSHLKWIPPLMAQFPATELPLFYSLPLSQASSYYFDSSVRNFSEVLACIIISTFCTSVLSCLNTISVLGTSSSTAMAFTLSFVRESISAPLSRTKKDEEPIVTSQNGESSESYSDFLFSFVSVLVICVI